MAKKNRKEVASPEAQAIHDEGQLTRKEMKRSAHVDEVIVTNVFADFHRVLQDRIDCDFSTPASANEFDPAEITRRSGFGLLCDVVEMVAIKWRDFKPEPGMWDEMTAQEARGNMIANLTEMIRQDAPDAEAGLRTELAEAYQDRKKVGVELSDETLGNAIEAGIVKGRGAIKTMLEWMEQDEPSNNYPDALTQQGAAIETCWGIVSTHIKKHVPEEVELPQDMDALYALAYIDVAQNALAHAFNLAAFGVIDPEQPHDAPRLFAGSILSEMGIPQPYIDHGPSDDEEAAAKEEGYMPSPTPDNGDVAESPQAVLTRELMMVCNAIAEDLMYGQLRKEVKHVFREMAAQAFATEPDPDCSPMEFFLRSNGMIVDKKPDLTVTKKMNKMASVLVNGVMDDIIGDFKVELKAQDGWVVDRSKLTTTDDKLNYMPIAQTPFSPHTATLQ